MIEMIWIKLGLKGALAAAGAGLVGLAFILAASVSIQYEETVAPKLERLIDGIGAAGRRIAAPW